MPSQTRDLLSVDKDSFPYIFEQNVTVPLKTSEGLVRLNVYRPKTEEKVPVIVTYGPYGKDIPYSEYVHTNSMELCNNLLSGTSLQF
jgi:predicted acyl esterase